MTHSFLCAPGTKFQFMGFSPTDYETISTITSSEQQQSLPPRY